MDPDASQQDYQRWLNKFLNRPENYVPPPTFTRLAHEHWERMRKAKRLAEIDDLEHMWALPEREER